MARGWWRRNALALGAIAILAPVTAVAISLNAWQDLGRVQRVVVEQGESVAYGGAEVGPARAQYDDDVEKIPHGTRVIAVGLDIDPRGEPFPCTIPSLVEASGQHREWLYVTQSLGRPYDENRVTFCDPDLTEPFTLQVDYLVPDDASGPFELEFSSSNAVPELLRLPIDP